MWIIFGVIISIFGLFLIYSMVKNRVERNKKAKEKIIFHNKATIEKRKLIFELNQLIEKNAELLKHFEPSVGEYKMSQITSTAHKYLKSKENEKNFKEFIVASDEASKYLNVFINLSQNNSNMWEKKFPQILKMINSDYQEIQDELTDDEKVSIKDKVENFYSQEFGGK
ncbi:MHJ_0274 family protein [Mycoplasmopsis gallinarum]|uniref:MHJ_0274 family protein n=1 Tax=Mycoplasmopsis gallinarum TaxID=29557 RepID=UPI000683FC91|nr:hypothetical protein [Mycoplasmopsis gallinarum]